MTRGAGQDATQLPLYKAAVVEHVVQFVVVPLQVAHTVAQGSQIMVTSFLIVMLSGQELAHIPLYI